MELIWLVLTLVAVDLAAFLLRRRHPPRPPALLPPPPPPPLGHRLNPPRTDRRGLVHRTRTDPGVSR